MAETGPHEVVVSRIPFWNINLGHILTVASLLIGGGAAYAGMKAEMQNYGQRLERVESALTQLTTILTTQATASVEINELKRRLDRIELKILQAPIPVVPVIPLPH